MIVVVVVVVAVDVVEVTCNASAKSPRKRYLLKPFARGSTPLSLYNDCSSCELQSRDCDRFRNKRRRHGLYSLIPILYCSARGKTCSSLSGAGVGCVYIIIRSKRFVESDIHRGFSLSNFNRIRHTHIDVCCEISLSSIDGTAYIST